MSTRRCVLLLSHQILFIPVCRLLLAVRGMREGRQSGRPSPLLSRVLIFNWTPNARSLRDEHGAAVRQTIEHPSRRIEVLPNVESLGIYHGLKRAPVYETHAYCGDTLGRDGCRAGTRRAATV